MDLWAAIEEAAPEVAQVLQSATASEPHTGKYADYPGLREWLLVEFAVNTPTSLVIERLRAIQEDQIERGYAKAWPTMSKVLVDAARRDMASEWRPIRTRIEDRIEQVGVVKKQNRLMALASLAEELRERMYTERNEKTGQMYLQHDYAAVLRQIAEEVGDLGVAPGDNTGGLIEIARTLAGLVKVQGSGIQERAIDTGAYDEVAGAAASLAG